MPQAGSPHTYFAFISYKHEDEKHAKWLKRRLEQYRLPSRLCKKYDNLPKRLSKTGDVYLDKETLGPGLIEETLKKDMAATKYLIVICSQSCHDHPKYIDQEITAFLNAGHTPDQIIPYIVDDLANPEQTCFPPMLQQLNEVNELIGVNTHDAGQRQAFLKVVAHILDILKADLESAEDRRRRRNILLAALCAVVLVIAGWFCYDYFAPHYAYYVDYTEVWGIPQGIGEVSKRETAHMNAHYTIKTQFHKVQELRHENSDGRMVDHSNTEYTDRPAKAVYTYNDDDKLESVTYQNAKEQTVLTLSYVNRNTIDLQNAETGTSISLMADTTAISHANIYASSVTSTSHSSILRYIVEYDEEGYVTERRYASNGYNSPTSDASDVWGLRYGRDKLGRPIAVDYLTYTGEGSGAKGAADRENYNEFGNRRGIGGRRYQYEGSDLISVTYVSTDGTTPVLNEQFWATRKATYDPHHNCTREDFLGDDGNPCINEDGVAVWQAEYDKCGNIVKTAYF